MTLLKLSACCQGGLLQGTTEAPRGHTKFDQIRLALQEDYPHFRTVGVLRAVTLSSLVPLD